MKCPSCWIGTVRVDPWVTSSLGAAATGGRKGRRRTSRGRTSRQDSWTGRSTALLEKQSKFPRYKMKCRGKPDTTWNIPRSITFSPLHFVLFRGRVWEGGVRRRRTSRQDSWTGLSTGRGEGGRYEILWLQNNLENLRKPLQEFTHNFLADELRMIFEKKLMSNQFPQQIFMYYYFLKKIWSFSKFI